MSAVPATLFAPEEMEACYYAFRALTNQEMSMRLDHWASVFPLLDDVVVARVWTAFFQKPCVILRPETEWVELVENGNAIVVDADKGKIIEAFNTFQNESAFTYPQFYGDGQAAEFICGEIVSQIES